MESREIEYAGQTFDVLADAGRDFFVLRAMLRAKESPEAIFDAYDIVFLGRTDEYAERLGRDFEMVNGLYQEAISGESKN